MQLAQEAWKKLLQPVRLEPLNQSGQYLTAVYKQRSDEPAVAFAQDLQHLNIDSLIQLEIRVAEPNFLYSTLQVANPSRKFLRPRHEEILANLENHSRAQPRHR